MKLKFFFFFGLLLLCFFFHPFAQRLIHFINLKCLCHKSKRFIHTMFTVWIWSLWKCSAAAVVQFIYKMKFVWNSLVGGILPFSMEFNKLSSRVFYSFLISHIIKLAITHIDSLLWGPTLLFFFCTRCNKSCHMWCISY